MISDSNIFKKGSSILKTSWGEISQFIRVNPITAGAIGAGIAGVGVAVTQTIKKRRAKKKKSTTKRKTTKRKTSKKRKVAKRKKQRKPYTAGKRKDTSTRRIRFTKNNQPYVILKSGKARFIKKSSVSRMRKRKGGKY